MRSLPFAALGAALLFSVAPGCREAPPAEPPPPPAVGLSDDIHSGCYRWPEATFTRRNYAQVEIPFTAGDRAVEFALRDVNGAEHRLSALLETAPVVLILGSFT